MKDNQYIYFDYFSKDGYQYHEIIKKEHIEKVFLQLPQRTTLCFDIYNRKNDYYYRKDIHYNSPEDAMRAFGEIYKALCESEKPLRIHSRFFDKLSAEELLAE